jgi:hypothetical protein
MADRSRSRSSTSKNPACRTIAFPRANRLATQRKSLRAAEQDRPDVATERRRWRVWQRHMDPARFVFRDETGATTNMVRRCG